MEKSINAKAVIKEKISSLMHSVEECLKSGDLEKAKSLLGECLALDFNDKTVAKSLMNVDFWIERKARFQHENGYYDRGIYLLHHWKVFISFSKGEKDNSESDELIYPLKYWVFNQALQNFKEASAHASGLSDITSDSQTAATTGLDDPDFLRKIGFCYKNLGDYSTALEYLETAMSYRSECASLMAEAADCYALVNELKISKLYFREAFFIDPQSVDILSLESILIKKLVERVQEMWSNEKQMKEWIPVYGALYGVFNMKRELKALEVVKLKQSITTLEHQIDDKEENRDIVIPRLINHYFWLIDYYMSVRDSKDRIEDILRKINKINPSIYELYSN